MSKKVFPLLFTVSCFVSQAYALVPVSFTMPNVIAVSGGPTWTQINQNQPIELLPGVFNTYVAPNQTDTLFQGELFVGWQKSLDSMPAFLQYGVTYFLTTSAEVNGVIQQLGLPQFENETYQYKTYHSHVAIKGKLIESSENKFAQFYVGASVGVGFNDAYGFTNMPLADTVLPSPNFTGHTQTSFTYTVSIGLQKKHVSNWILGLEYLIADWGKSYLGRAVGQTMGDGPKLSNLYTNGVQLNITYAKA